MATRATVPLDFRASSEATLVGTVKERGELRAIRGGDFVRITMIVGEDEFETQAKGDAAVRMARYKTGQAIRVSGHLAQYNWTTRDKTEQKRTVIVVEHSRPYLPQLAKDMP